MWPRVEALAGELVRASGCVVEEGAVRFWVGSRLARELEPGVRGRGREEEGEKKGERDGEEKKRRTSEEAREELVQRLRDLCVD